MDSGPPRHPSGFHAGEIAVQRLLGVRAEAAALEGMLAPATISRGMAGFLAQRTFAAITARDGEGLLWSSPLVAPAGFLEVTSPRTLLVHAAPPPHDPLHDLEAGQPVGLVAMDFARRRRFRINGFLTIPREGVFEVTASEAFGNCPQYITPRSIEPLTEALAGTEGAGPAVAAAGSLTASDLSLVLGATSFFLGTTHPDRGTDVSHRGGPPGFVRRDGDSLWWPDYPGNNLFNSLGNLHVDSEAALLIPDFADGRALQLHGRAELVVSRISAAAAPDETGRRVVFTPQHRAAGALPARSRLLTTPDS